MRNPPIAGRPFAFASPAEAVSAARAELSPLGSEPVSLALTGGRVLAEPIRADRDSPPMDVSAMDGFAIRLENVAAMTSDRGIPVAPDEARIGSPPMPMPRGAIGVRIVTGAPVPTGSDAVIRREDVIESGAGVRLKVATEAVKAGAHIRRRGENAKINATILLAGTIVTGASVGALASIGVAEVPVHRRVRIAIISTGDELVPVNVAPLDWQLRDGNAPAIKAMLGARRWIEVQSTVHVRDDEKQLEAALRAAAANSDAIVLSGGVSMGHRDFVPSAVATLGARTIFHGLPQRPGKPMLAAVLPRDGGRVSLPILGLPGNPVSVLVTCRRLAIPILGKLAGLPDSSMITATRTLAASDEARIDLWWHRAVSQEAGGALRLISSKSSGDFAAVAGSAGFVEISPGKSGAGPWPFFAWDH